MLGQQSWFTVMGSRSTYQHYRLSVPVNGQAHPSCDVEVLIATLYDWLKLNGRSWIGDRVGIYEAIAVSFEKYDDLLRFVRVCLEETQSSGRSTPV